MHSWDVTRTALASFGYRAEWRFERSPSCAGTLEAIRDELVAGRPVIAPGIMPAPDGIHSRCNYWFVVTGVDVGRQEIKLLGAMDEQTHTRLPWGDSTDPLAHPRWFGITRTFDGMSCHYGPGHGADCPIIRIEKADDRMPEPERVRQALRHAVSLAAEPPVTASYGWGAGTYLAGHAALQKLHDDLLSAEGNGIDEFTRLNPRAEEPFGGLFDELEQLRLLATRRRAAASFLQRTAERAPMEARRHLAAAATQFTTSATAAAEAFRVRYESWESLSALHVLVASDPHAEDDPDWTTYWRRADNVLADRVSRRTMAEHVAGALEAERAAVDNIQQALASVAIP